MGFLAGNCKSASLKVNAETSNALFVFCGSTCSTTPAVSSGSYRLQHRCLSGLLKQGGGDLSRALWGHLWNRLTNVSLLCHKDTRLTKLAINVPFTTHLFVTQVFIPAVSCTVLPQLTRPWAISRMSSKEASPWGTVLGDSRRILMGCPRGPPPLSAMGVGGVGEKATNVV